MRVHAYDLAARLQAGTGRHLAGGGAFSRAVDDEVRGVRLLVLDELHVHDSDDGWLLEALLRRLHAAGGSLVATSNTPVDGLHRAPLTAHHADGLRALLATTTTSFAFDGPRDHRGPGAPGDRPRFTSGAFLPPGSGPALAGLGLSRPGPQDRREVVAGGRGLPVLGAVDGVVRAGFTALCERPVAPGDLAELAEGFPAWVVAGVPPLAGCVPDARARFVALVDVAHDRDVRLVLVARQGFAATVEGVDAGEGPGTTRGWERTASRLCLLQRPAG